MIFGADEVMTRWVGKHVGSQVDPHPTAKAIGVIDGGKIIAGVQYDQFNGVNIVAEIAALPKTRWATKARLFQIFNYPFNVIGAARITCLINQTNAASQKLCKGLGFHQEGVLRGAAADGGDVLVFAMHRNECKWIMPHGKVTESTTSSGDT